jgi:hypothetical protein
MPKTMTILCNTCLSTVKPRNRFTANCSCANPETAILAHNEKGLIRMQVGVGSSWTAL